MYVLCCFSFVYLVLCFCLTVVAAVLDCVCGFSAFLGAGHFIFAGGREPPEAISGLYSVLDNRSSWDRCWGSTVAISPYATSVPIYDFVSKWSSPFMAAEVRIFSCPYSLVFSKSGRDDLSPTLALSPSFAGCSGPSPSVFAISVPS